MSKASTRTVGTIAFLGFVALTAADAQSVRIPQRNAFTFLHYDLKVTVDRRQHSLGCRGTVTLRNDSNKPESQVPLQLSSSLAWASIRLKNEPVRFTSNKIQSDIDHTGSVNEVILDLPEPVAPRSSIVLEVGYSGTVTLDTTRLVRIGAPAAAARANDWDRISEDFTGVRGLGNVVWYPVAVEPALLGDGRRVLERLEEFRARHAESSGRIQIDIADMTDGSVALGNGNATRGPSSLTLDFSRFGLQEPMFLIAKYTSIETRWGQLWFLPGGETSAQRYVANISKLKPIVANGTTSRMDLIQLQDGSANYESGPMFLLPLTDVNENQIQQLLIHTLTHATFFSRRPWMFEGLAHYAQARTVENQFGRLGALQYLAQRRPALALAEPANGSGQSLIQAEQEIFYRTKAMFVWWMLRDLLGESTLHAALAKYRVDQDREPAYIQRLLEAESKKNLETVFDDWVYRDRGLPDFRITNVYTRQHLRGGYLNTVTVENTGTAGAEVLVQLRAKQTGGEERLYVPAGKSASVRIELPLAPVEATVNDGSVPEVDVSNNTYAVEAAKQ